MGNIGEWMAKAYFIIAAAIMVIMIAETAVKRWRRNRKNLPEENIIF